MASGRYNHSLHKGGVLLTAISLLSLLSMMMVFLLATYRSSTEFTQRMNAYYQMRMMSDLFLAECAGKSDLASHGRVNYNVGYLTYVAEKESIHVHAVVKEYSYKIKKKRQTMSEQSSGTVESTQRPNR